MHIMIIHILISLLSFFVIIFYFGAGPIVLISVIKMNHVWWCFLFFVRACLRAAALMLNVCLHPAARCSIISHFLDQPNEERSFDTDSPRLLFLFRKLSVCGQCCCFFFFSSFPVVLRVPVSCCSVVSKTIGITVRLAGRNGGLGTEVPNVPWHVRWRAGWWEMVDAMKG